MFSTFLGCSANLNEQTLNTREQVTKDSEFQEKKTNSYVVFGKRYYPMDSATNFYQKGVASWYGQKFHGRKTSNGEIYDMYEMTAAHKRLPLPTDLEVRNLENNKRVIVRVNDRGPFHGERIIDLSFAAALKLGMIEKGTAYVEIKTLPESSEDSARRGSKETLTRETFEMHLQIGAFSDAKNADSLLRQVSKITGREGRIRTSTTNTSSLYRVQLGPLLNVAEVEHVVVQLRELGINEYYLVND